MAFISPFGEKLLLCAKNSLILLDLSSGMCDRIDIPVTNLQKTEHEDVLEESSSSYDSFITSFCISQDCLKFAVCTKYKQLFMYNDKFDIVGVHSLARIASKVIFSKDCSSFLVADKTGDVYLHSLKNRNKSQLILGHLSMLLDIILTDDEKYVITCDRDEKIRVSCFPNSYNIVSYCLGHKEFIMSIKLINDNILVSASGDGTVKFWDFIKGQQLYTLNCNEFVTDKNIKMFINKMDLDNVDISALPVSEIHICNGINYIHLAVNLQCVHNIQIYDVILNNGILIDLVEILPVRNRIISFCFIKMQLFVLSENEISSYTFDSSSGIYGENKLERLQLFFNSYKHLLQGSISKDISVFYKRKYDNVQEYQERKKLRLESKKS